MMPKVRIVQSASLALAIVLGVPALRAQSSMVVTRARSARGDILAVRVMDPDQHLVFHVYFDSASQAVAFKTIPTIDSIYAMLSRNLGADPARVEWAAVAFVTDTAYLPPRNNGEVRWSVKVEPSGELGPQGETDLYLTLPHEQVHSLQNSLTDGAPRWFQEGQAQWAGLRVTDRLRPALAAQKRQEDSAAYAGLPRRLAAWGGVIVKREAILRQMTAEQRARLAADSTYQPPGPWKFSPSDFISDESATPARYGAALALFTELERARGLSQLVNWYRQLWVEPKLLTTKSLTASVQEYFGLDIGSRLR
jgi:hypothetical protein